MRHAKKGRKLNRTSSHRLAMNRNLAMSLIEHKQIKTTLPKAKELQSFVERLVTYAKKNNLSSFRLITQKLPGRLGKKITNILIHEIAPKFIDRNGGYTRIIKLGNRNNDNAQMSIIEFVGLQTQEKAEDIQKQEDNK